ncbi:lipopolysaccharide biosynthesis protein [Mucilaginibacter sp. L3T2-6]|uniref:lipopolysaccharide biosynthesis protein n=1 Tax=Mucilaginibacter sp. L3T2-6 TaxID=3062491 RepID=UPI0026751963|nr:oligosaccharide flippase family protein [Mucilaginibacter sp. L3T2-6]MDO3642992.1 oligosaccharide flippase family protein [Mucilaginibacter sp. L3T2-6]MDV6215317.1 oligosaccharide flippase family protein [Mucilaginibacter sp. L3T2-6]
MRQGIVKKLKLRLDKDRTFLISFISTAVSRGISGFGTIFLSFVLARQLGAANYGRFMLAYSILMGLGIASNFGMDQALLKYASILFHDKDKVTLRHLRKSVLIASTLISLFFALGLFTSKGILAEKLFGVANFNTVLIVMAINVPFYANILLQSTYLKAFKRPEIAPFVEIGLLAFLTGLFVITANFFGVDITPFSTSVILLIATIVVLAIGQITLEFVLRKLKNEAARVRNNINGFFLSLPDFAISSITTYLLNFSPGIILGLYATPRDIGLYNIARNVSFLINFILAIINNVTAPYFATYFKNKDMESLQNLARNSTLYMLLIATPAFLVVLCFPTQILHIFGNAFTPAKNALILLSAAQLFNVLTGPIFFLLNMTGHQRYLRNNVMLTAVITITCSIFFSKYWGYWGAAIATAIGLVLQNAFAYYHANRLLGINLYGRYKRQVLNKKDK